MAPITEFAGGAGTVIHDIHDLLVITGIIVGAIMTVGGLVLRTNLKLNTLSIKVASLEEAVRAIVAQMTQSQENKTSIALLRTEFANCVEQNRVVHDSLRTDIEKLRTRLDTHTELNGRAKEKS